jgi:predicted  nucleic acid-binding Zn-ribbon protein
MEDHYLTRQHMQSLLKIAHQMESHSLSSETTAEASRTTSATAPWQELHETSSTLERCSETTNDGGQRLSNDSSQNQANVKLSEEESCACMQDVKHNQDSTSLKEKINDMQYVSYDGTLIWKITKFQEKMGR